MKVKTIAILPLLAIVASYVNCFPTGSARNAIRSQASKRRNGVMSANSHPMLASVFSLANNVEEINHQNRKLKKASAAVARPPVRVPSISKGTPLALLGHGQALPAGLPLPQKKNADGSDSSIIGPLADMQCELCRQTNNLPCIQRFCWTSSSSGIGRVAARPSSFLPHPSAIIRPGDLTANPIDLSAVSSTHISHGNPSIVLPPSLPFNPSSSGLTLPMQPPIAANPVRLAGVIDPATQVIALTPNGQAVPGLPNAQTIAFAGNVGQFPSANMGQPLQAVASGNPIRHAPGLNPGVPPLSVSSQVGHLPMVPMLPMANIPVTGMQLNPAGPVPQVDNVLTMPQIVPTNSHGVQQVPNQGAGAGQVIPAQVPGKQGLDLVQNTVFQTKDIPVSGNMFETHVDKLHTVRFGTNGIQTGAMASQNTANPRGAASQVIGASVARAAINRQNSNPNMNVPHMNTMGHSMQGGVQQQQVINVPDTGLTMPRLPSRDGISSGTDIPSVPVANDVFGANNSPLPSNDPNRHTLVLKPQLGGGDKLGIVIGDSQPSNGGLSLLETSGQLPSLPMNIPEPSVSMAGMSPFAQEITVPQVQQSVISNQMPSSQMSSNQMLPASNQQQMRPLSSNTAPVAQQNLFIPMTQLTNRDRRTVQQSQIGSGVAMGNNMQVQSMMPRQNMANGVQQQHANVIRQNNMARTPAQVSMGQVNMGQMINPGVANGNAMQGVANGNTMAGVMQSSVNNNVGNNIGNMIPMNIHTNNVGGMNSNTNNGVGAFPAGFVETTPPSTTTTTDMQTMNPIRKAELHNWGSNFIPKNI